MTIIIVVVLNIGLFAAFIVFYRMKRKQWAKRSASVSPASSSHLLTISSNNAKVYPSAPPIPTRPKTASGSLGGSSAGLAAAAGGPPPIHNSGASPNVVYKRQPGELSSANSRQRFSGLSASSLASLPRD